MSGTRTDGWSGWQQLPVSGDRQNESMTLPLQPPVRPMLAAPVAHIPDTGNWLFEPKWDGFRCLTFFEGGELTMQSRNGRPLHRYFPEMVEALRTALPEQIVLDGELVIARDGRLDFDALSERVHPAATRIQLLAEQTPAIYVGFDLLAIGDRDLTGEPTSSRRAELCGAVAPADRLRITPATTDHVLAAEWFTRFEGAGLDGVVGKPLAGPYTPNKRTMIKVKHNRTADCVVAGLRWHTDSEPGTAVGSLLIGLHDRDGVLHHVGVIGAFPAADRRALAAELRPLMEGASEGHPWLGSAAEDGRRLPGSVNRWRSGEQPWVPLRPVRVVEVRYDHTEGGYPPRLRHTAQFVRWRDDREPSSCGYDQLDEPVSYDLAAVLNPAG